jgi:hypothetical protein
MTPAERYWRLAADFHYQANAESDPHRSERWRAIARSYERLATQAESGNEVGVIAQWVQRRGNLGGEPA